MTMTRILYIAVLALGFVGALQLASSGHIISAGVLQLLCVALFDLRNEILFLFGQGASND